MKNKQYWINRVLEKDKYLEKNLKIIEKELKKSYREAIKEIKKEIAFLYTEKELTEWQQYHAEETIRSLESILDEMYKREEQMLQGNLVNVYKDIFEKECDEFTVNVSFNTVSDKLIREVIKTNWSGLTFSERIWGNGRNKLAIKVKEILNKGLKRGDSLQDMARLLSNELNKDYNRALTLVHTETCWVQNQATLDSYKEADLKEYEFCAFIDRRTSDACKELDGTIIKIKDGVAGVNLPPLHPRCRSCIIPVID